MSPPASRDSSVSARAGMIASSSGAASPSSVSLTESRYESVATMTSFPASKRTRIPVSTGRDSSREAERATRSMVSSSASRSIACSWASTAGSRGKSSALKTCSRELYEPETICTVPSSGLYSSVTSVSGSRRASSTNGLPGMTTAPSPSTRASRVVRSDSSMSVAASVSTSPSTLSRIPESTCTVPRVETARETMPSFATSSSRATLDLQPRSRWPCPPSSLSPVTSSRRPVPAVSISIVSLNPLVEVIGSVDDGEDGAILFPERRLRCGVHPRRKRGYQQGRAASTRFHRNHPACLIRAVSSCTRLYTDRSSRIIPSIFAFACITVVWSRPPNSLPIFGSDESVRARERYIATWRG